MTSSDDTEVLAKAVAWTRTEVEIEWVFHGQTRRDWVDASDVRQARQTPISSPGIRDAATATTGEHPPPTTLVTTPPAQSLRPPGMRIDIAAATARRREGLALHVR